MADESAAFLAQERSYVASRISTVFVSISLFFLLLRLCTRGLITHAHGPEDYCIVAAWVLSVGYTCCTWIEDINGQGHHDEVVPADKASRMAEALYFSLILYQAALVLIKFSFLCQYWRLFPTVRTRLAVRIIGILVLAYGIYSVTANIFICTPIRHFWSSSGSGSCIDRKALWFVNAALNIATDLAILCIPIPAVHSLRIPRAQKASLIAIFALGVFVCIVSVIRLRPLADMVDSSDLTWEDGPVAYWTAIEINTGIMCACLPTLKPLLIRAIPGWRNSGERFDLEDDGAEIREMTLTVTNKSRDRAESLISHVPVDTERRADSTTSLV